MTGSARSAATLPSIEALLLDLDGVLTPTAEVHMRAWARLFSEFLASRDAGDYSDDDYFAFIDGKPRYDGVRAMLASRGIVLPEGEPSDDSTLDTVHGLGNRKNDAFRAELAEHGVEPYAGSVALLDAAAALGIQLAVVTSSRNGHDVLAAAGLADRFEIVVDGMLAAAEGLAGKPDPATYLEAAARLGVPKEACAVVEDAHSGVAAGRAGAFGLVVGVDRGAGVDALLANGADIVVSDLAELIDDLGAQR